MGRTYKFARNTLFPARLGDIFVWTQLATLVLVIYWPCDPTSDGKIVQYSLYFQRQWTESSRSWYQRISEILHANSSILWSYHDRQQRTIIYKYQSHDRMVFVKREIVLDQRCPRSKTKRLACRNCVEAHTNYYKPVVCIFHYPHRCLCSGIQRQSCESCSRQIDSKQNDS